MRFSEQNLMPDEQILLTADIHRAIFISPAILLGVAILHLIFSLSHQAVAYLAWLTLLVAFAVGIHTAVTAFTTRFALTDHRVIAQAGLVRRRSVDLPLTHIESIDVDQSIAGRRFDFGALTLVGPGGARYPFVALARPEELRQQIQAQIDSLTVRVDCPR